MVYYIHPIGTPQILIGGIQMEKFRTIYLVEGYEEIGELIFRRFARNKKTAERIANNYPNLGTLVRKLRKCEHQYVDPDTVEG